MRRWAAKVKRAWTGLAGRLGRVARWMAGTSIVSLASLAALFPSAREIPAVWMPLLTVSLFALLLAPGVWVAGWVAKLWGRFREAQVHARDGALVVGEGDAAKTYPELELQSGVVIPIEDGGAELQITLRRGDTVRVRMDSPEEADALLEQLALGPGQKRLVVRWARLFHQLGAAFLTYMLTSLPMLAFATKLESSALHTPAAMLWMVLPLLLAGLATRLVRREVVAGNDGVEGRIGVRRFAVSYAAVKELVLRDDEILIRFDEGAVSIPLDMDQASLGLALGRRLEAALRHYRRYGESSVARFARGGVDFDEWKRRLQRLFARETTLREAPVRAEDALRVVEDPEADPEARAGAAIALAAGGTDDDRRRVRVAVEASAHPKVRVALEAALRGELDEEAIVEAREARAG